MNLPNFCLSLQEIIADMKRIVLLLLTCFALSLHAQLTQKELIDSLIANHPVMKQASLGLLIYDSTADSVLYSLDAQKLHRPASTTKTFSCATALKHLGANYVIKTSVYATGEVRKQKVNGVKKHILEGDLWVKGNFDPAFTSSDLDTLLLNLKANQIDSIAGNIYADRSMKNRVLTGYGWCWDDKGDDSPLLDPLVVDKDTCFMTKFVAGLDSLGIGFSGMVGDSIYPTESKLLAEKCRTLHELLPHCLKTSDNRYAESILYQLGNLNEENYDETSSSLFFVNELIRNLGFDDQDFHFVDGSGLSFYNMVTPQVEVALLNFVLKESDFYEEFKSALPVSGVDGTLKNRMKGTAAEGIVFAKTGSLTGTYALVGYLYRADGHVLVFSMMNDGVPSGKGTAIRGLQDDILIVLAENK